MVPAGNDQNTGKNYTKKKKMSAIQQKGWLKFWTEKLLWSFRLLTTCNLTAKFHNCFELTRQKIVGKSRELK